MPRRQLVCDEDRLAMYRAGLTDAELARLWGISPLGVKSWRQDRGLKANRGPRADKGVKRGSRTLAHFTPAPLELPEELRLPREPREWRTMLHVDIATGRVTENRLPWWLRKEERSA